MNEKMKSMAICPLAYKPAPKEMLVDLARPSGTENIYKIYAESFKNEKHLQAIVSEAQQIVNNALAGSWKPY